jgi:hypothetical protein
MFRLQSLAIESNLRRVNDRLDRSPGSRRVHLRQALVQSPEVVLVCNKGKVVAVSQGSWMNGVWRARGTLDCKEQPGWKRER